MKDILLQDELDFFIKNNLIIGLVEGLDISSEESYQTEPSAVFNKIYDDECIPELEKRVKHAQNSQSLGEYIEELIRQKKHKHYSDLSMRAGITKEYWHKIIKGKIARPSKAKLLCIAIALKLNLEETERLLRMAGLSFTSDLTILESIFAFFIEKEKYNVFEIDIQLERYGQPTIYSIK